METHRNELIRTIQRDDRIGALMNRSDYDEIKTFILKTLDEYDPITINSLIGKGHDQFSPQFKGQTGWYLYNVKLDLEARGLISHVYPDKKQKRAMISRSYSREKVNNRLHPNLPGIDQVEINQPVRQKFIELFGKYPFIVHAPGRINLIGEHTDYNSGFVLPAAIDKGVQFAVNTSARETLIYSMKYKEFLSIDINKIKPSRTTEWHNYLLGILFKLKEKGYPVKNFSCVFEGDLPTGAGLSSSAAMECGFIMALNTLFNFRMKAVDMIKIAQWSEHNYVGVKCGIMDQFASMLSKRDHAMMLDCKTLDYRYFPLDLGKYCLLLCDTNIKHSLASSEYNVRRDECLAGLKIIKESYGHVKTLRDVTPEMLATCQSKMPRLIFNRCKYVIQENRRVLNATADLQKGNLIDFGNRMYESHEGLRYLYEVSCPELDFLVDLTKSYHGVLGSRMMGGGFGGCTINIIESDLVGSFIEKARTVYKETFRKDLSYYVVKTGNGARVLEEPNTNSKSQRDAPVSRSNG